MNHKHPPTKRARKGLGEARNGVPSDAVEGALALDPVIITWAKCPECHEGVVVIGHGYLSPEIMCEYCGRIFRAKYRKGILWR